MTIHVPLWAVAVAVGVALIVAAVIHGDRSDGYMSFDFVPVLLILLGLAVLAGTGLFYLGGWLL